MNAKLPILVFLLLLFPIKDAFAQFGFSQELGVITGPVTFYSDFGQRNNFETNINNVGIGIGLIHYINFAYRADCNCYTRDVYWNDHFKIRSEIDYHITNFEHYGEWVDESKNSERANQLRAMSGTSKVLEIGSQLEYFPLSIRDFQAGQYRIAPFVSAGAHFVSYDPEVSSSLGELNTPTTTFDKYFNSFQQDQASTWAVVGSVGIRYKLTDLSDLMLDSRWTYYFTDYVDGLNPTFENNQQVQVPENKANDWTYWLNVGYIYYIN